MLHVNVSLPYQERPPFGILMFSWPYQPLPSRSSKPFPAPLATLPSAGLWHLTALPTSHLSLLRFWCLFIHKHMPNNAVMLPNGRWPAQWGQPCFAATQHCLAFFWRHTNIRISQDLANWLPTNIKISKDSDFLYHCNTTQLVNLSAPVWNLLDILHISYSRVI